MRFLLSLLAFIFISNPQFIYSQIEEDSIQTKIYFASGFDDGEIQISLNKTVVGSNVYLKSNPIYGLTDFEIVLVKTHNVRKLNVLSPQMQSKLCKKKRMILKLKSSSIDFSFDLSGKEKYLVVSKQGDNIYVTQFKKEPGFD